MSDYLPIVVAAPSDARSRLLQKSILPQKLFRNLATESLWDDHPGPAVYLWPYDIPYADSDRFRDEVTERVGDLPAFFGMNPGEAKDHQERMLSRILFGSIVVHILFLDNRKTDTTPGVEERNETYAQFCTFGEIVQWSRDLKKVMEVRLLNNESNSVHILVIVSANQQVVTTAEEVKALNDCIGESAPGKIKPFRACYFMDLNLNPGDSKKIIHSKYVWDVQVSRLLLALLLSQEKIEREDNKFGRPDPLHEIAGVKVWRAEDCVFTVDREYSREVLKETLEAASKKLMNQTADPQPAWIRLESDVQLENKGLLVPIEPDWNSENKEIISRRRADAADNPAAWNCFQMMFSNWADLPTESLKQDLLSPEHWKKSFEKRQGQRLEWSRENAPRDYTQSVGQFFDKLKSRPGILRTFSENLHGIMKERYERQKSEKQEFWSQIAKLEKRRLSAEKEAREDSREFKKAQDYYVGRGIALLIAAAVTAFSGWMIWWVLYLLGAGPKTIFPLFIMVFAGSAVAYILLMLLHNFTGNRAANGLVKEYDGVDRLMIERDEKVKEMFFQGVLTRDVLTLQNVRFRTWQLAKRILAIMETELQPSLSQLSDDNGEAGGGLSKPDPVEDKDGVRDAFLKMTRVWNGPFKPDKGKGEKFDQDKIIDSFFAEDGTNGESFLEAWGRVCSFDAKNAGYYPANALVSELGDFVRRFFRRISEKLLESIDIKKAVGDGVGNYLDERKGKNTSKNFLSASLPADAYSKGRTSYVFFNSSFEDSGDKVIDGNELRRFPSDELSKTTILALFFQEYSLRFALKEIPGKEYGQLTFESSDGES